MLKYYLNELGYPLVPEFLIKYLNTPSLLRLKWIGYFCGMDYASKNIYDFSEYISRYDHSLAVSLIVYQLTKNKKAALAGLFHDIATPCFSHVIDYMNKDYEKQESTEEYTADILLKDEYLKKCLEEDNININEVINFKQYTIVDNERPKLCADRLDGVILTGIGWTKNISRDDIKEIVQDMHIFINEDKELEIGFSSYEVAMRVFEISETINEYCHFNEDNYMMQLLADITKLAIDKEYIMYRELFSLNEKELFELLKKKADDKLRKLLFQFENIKKDEIPEIEIPKLKVRKINPLILGKRIN